MDMATSIGSVIALAPPVVVKRGVFGSMVFCGFLPRTCGCFPPPFPSSCTCSCCGSEYVGSGASVTFACSSSRRALQRFSVGWCFGFIIRMLIKVLILRGVASFSPCWNNLPTYTRMPMIFQGLLFSHRKTNNKDVVLVEAWFS